MPRKSIEPLHKITIDLYAADFAWLQANSLPLTETIREAVREKVVMLRGEKQRMTLGDLLIEQGKGYAKAEASWPKTERMMRPK